MFIISKLNNHFIFKTYELLIKTVLSAELRGAERKQALKLTSLESSKSPF